jgi:hypothetical protein
MSNHPPSFVLTKLYRKKSEKGNTYFTGRLGGARVVLLKSNDTADDGGEVWNLLASEAPAKRDQDAAQRPQEPERRQTAPAQRDWQRPMDDL